MQYRAVALALSLSIAPLVAPHVALARRAPPPPTGLETAPPGSSSPGANEAALRRQARLDAQRAARIAREEQRAAARAAREEQHAAARAAREARHAEERAAREARQAGRRAQREAEREARRRAHAPPEGTRDYDEASLARERMSDPTPPEPQPPVTTH